MGFRQCRDRLTSLHEAIPSKGFELEGVFLGSPADRTEYRPSSTPRTAPEMLNSSCWKGYIAHFELGVSGRLTLRKYVALDNIEQHVDEVLTGDFWLELEGRNPFDGSERIQVAFEEGVIVEDPLKWAGDPRLLALMRMSSPRQPEWPLVGEIKWFGGLNGKTGRVNPYGFVTASGSDYYFHRAHTRAPLESLTAGTQVVFRRSNGSNGQPVAESVQVLSLLSDDELFALIKAPEWLSAQDTLAVGVLRSVLAPCELEVLAAVATLGVSNVSVAAFWRQFPPMSPKDSSYGLAPDELKRIVCKRYYAPIREALSGLFEPLNKVRTCLSSQDVYLTLDERDEQIAALWANGSSFDATLAKMLSARAAEKAIKCLYEEAGSTVEDVAIRQLDGGTSAWMTHDLLVDGELAIDVKNARLPVHGRGFYVEHTVPKFKLDRRGDNVVIAGLLSPYRRLEEIRDTRSASSTFRTDDLTFLGETSRASIDRLVSIFASARLEVVRRPERTVPNWVFGYPVAWFREFAAGVVRLNERNAWPEEDEWQYAFDDEERMACVPALLLAGRPLPAAISTKLSRQQVRFYLKLQRVVGCPPNLPVIFLAVLSDFLAQIKQGEPGFTPRDYLPLLFSSNFRSSRLSSAKDFASASYPLGAIDPLGLVRGLIETLATLWQGRNEAKLAQLSNFRFGGLGVLQGRESHEATWTTLVAYCGGTVYGTDERGEVQVTDAGEPLFVKGKCGQSPLIFGRDHSCPTCWKLVCARCGFCSLTCQERVFQKLADSRKRTRRSRTR